MTEAIDAQIEADMKVMQQVIVNGRAIRDRHNLSMRTPLPEATLVHKDAAALQAVTRTEAYISDELNVRAVKTALVSEVPHLVRFKCLPNHTLLGKRFGKEYGKVQGEIKKLTHEQLAAFVSSGTMTVAGHEFGKEDILVSLEFAGDKGAVDVEECEGGLVLLSTRPDGGMLDEATAREVCAKVQKMRRDAGLVKSDEVDVFFAASGATSSSMLANLLTEQRAYVEGRIGRPLLPASARPPNAVALLTTKTDVKVQRLVDGQIASSTEALTLTLVRGGAFFHPKKMAQVCPDATVRDGAMAFVQYHDLAGLRARLAKEGGVLKFALDKVQLALKHGEHFFLGSAEAAKAGVV